MQTAPDTQPLTSTPPLNLQDLRSVAEDIKASLALAAADLKRDIQNITIRIDDVEEKTNLQAESIHTLNTATRSHSSQLRELQRHIEDLDNRGHHHNLRVRGLPESVETSQITNATMAIFNDLLGRSPDTHIEFEHLHRALRPRSRDSDPPRGIV